MIVDSKSCTQELIFIAKNHLLDANCHVKMGFSGSSRFRSCVTFAVPLVSTLVSFLLQSERLLPVLTNSVHHF